MLSSPAKSSTLAAHSAASVVLSVTTLFIVHATSSFKRVTTTSTIVATTKEIQSIAHVQHGV